MPTTSASVRDIVIIGGSFAGQSAAHYIFKHVAQQLEECSPQTTFKVHIIDRSSHFWWRLAAPRAIVTSDTVPHDKAFIPIPSGFSDYDFARVKFEFTQGECTGIDYASRTVTVKSAATSESYTIPYYALVIASGTRTPTALTSLQGSHTESTKALDDMQSLLASGSVKHIVIGGGGPVGVEIAGELGDNLNDKPAHFYSAVPTPKVKITLVVGSDKMLPILRKSLSDQAEQMLRNVGVDVLYSTRIVSVTATNKAKTDVQSPKTIVLDNGTTLAADVYIPANGVQPNSSFLPASMLTDKGYVKVNKNTLRIEEPGVGPRIYCVGDVGTHSRGGAMNIYAAIPVFGHNFAKDVIADMTHEDGSKSEDKHFVNIATESQGVPVGRNQGVGAINGWQLPSFMIAFIKGRDYMVSKTGDITHGNKW